VKNLFLLTFCLYTTLFGQQLSVKQFLDKVEKDSFMYFWELYDDKLGLIPDSSREGSPCSIAAVGFGLTAFCIGAERGWVGKNEVFLRIYKTLNTFLNKLEHKNGFFYHFVDMKTGKRVWECEVSTIDTALFLAGAIVASEYFKGTKIEEMVKEIYDRIDWKWALNNRDVLCMGWKPEIGFLPYYWDTYSEHIILYALAIGAEKNPIPEECWYKWKRKKCVYGEYKFVASPTGSLFTYQFSHAYIDFRNIVDKYDGTNYFENSKIATLVNKKFCEKRKHKYKTYAEGFWGLSACIGPYGYKGYGSTPGSFHDGTVAPSAVGGSIMFLPEVCIPTLKLMYDKFKDKIYCEYGFVNGFNLDCEWFSDECLGIDTGITLLSIENYRTGFVWKHFMNHPSIKKFVSICFEKK
jgi:hypothetical protein